ncbi:cyclophane-forming radical SAM peptide maturase AmcB [Frankia sp. CIT1]|uniref:cyclophane-forming radical SAM peptide maturase AmcB n=2 Tax=unclassified Frankia TaxID=2632575 RepID=UPI00272DD895|nr:cyclophane-forming radical SAM peptide maturase AmcB [Frankia sp. CIT1]
MPPAPATITSVVMQPTPLCNLDCSYCYLPARRSRQLMAPSVARAVATGIEIFNSLQNLQQTEVIWHGGEPLTAGIQHFTHLMDCFPASSEHVIQTNATLIDRQWADLFEQRNIHIGISIDGDRAASAQRRDYAGREAFDRIVAGVEVLRDRGLSFDMIAVISDPSPQRAEELYAFSLSLGASSLAINIEEREGVNIRNHHFTDHAIADFWTALWEAWKSDPKIPVREFERIRAYTLTPGQDSESPLTDPFPTVAWDGNVTLYSPELSGYSSPHYGGFSCGNVLKHPLHHIILSGWRSSWVLDYARGVEECRESCRLFDFCRGGHAANRYFEHGRLDSTETSYCRNSKILLMEAVGGSIREFVEDWPSPPEQGASSQKFDNRPSWDNWGKKATKFDNSPSWDNWNKKGKKK